MQNNTIGVQTKKSPLIAIVTGLEHSGTTYLSKLITCHPQVNTGFECGVLLADSPQDFANIQPFYNWMQGKIEIGHWEIRKRDMPHLCAADSWEEMYQRIIQYSPLFKDKSHYLLDKTPGYMPYLEKILAKIVVPCLVIQKDIFFQYLSFKKRGLSLDKFVSWYVSYMDGLSRALAQFPDRIYLIEYETLYKNPLAKSREIFDFIGLDFQEDYLKIEPSSGQSAKLFNEGIKVNPLQRDFKYDEEIKKVTGLTEEEMTVLQATREKYRNTTSDILNPP